MIVTRDCAGEYARRIRFALFVLAGCWLISWLGARWLIVNEPVQHADAILVLSGSSTLIERTHYAAQLYSENRSDKILLTNDNRQGSWSSAEQRNPYFYERAVSELIKSGVPPQNIEVLSPPVSSTWDEAMVMKRYSETHQLQTVLVVTSGYHSRRARWTFNEMFGSGNTKVSLDSVSTGIQTPSPATWWLHINGWRMVPGEYLKLLYYFVHYRMLAGH
jgi:uncharacterized SAM-binding protein YcdF (DUF218 family)